MPTPDQALSFHRVSRFRYELSGLRTGSVRDQILRAHLLIERLLDDKELSDAPLLVIGGGAAGVAAALTASRRGRDVTLIEKQANTFKAQRQVATRWLSPTEFDWPQPHWRCGDMAWAGSNYPLPYKANWANQLAAQWMTLWASVVGPGAPPMPAGCGQIEEYFGVDARGTSINIAETSVGIQVTPWPQYGQAGRSYCAAVSCVGFSGEETSVPSSAGRLDGPQFWSTDTLATPRLGVTAPSRGPIRALVSGGGDGAQQDFLRILTGEFGEALFVSLGLDRLRLDLTPVLLAEDAARRAHAWAAPGTKPIEAYRRWHEAYEALADEVWRSWSATRSRPTQLALLNPAVHVTWLVSGETPGYAYGLNRLLAILVARLHALHGSRPRSLSLSTGLAPTGNEVCLNGFKLEQVVPKGQPHTCGQGCYGIEHEVIVCAAPPRVAPSLHSLGSFHVIVVRHGARPQPLFSDSPVSEQLVPFDLPG